MKNLRLVAVWFLVSAVSLIANAQAYNFDDLRKQGSSQKAEFTVPLRNKVAEVNDEMVGEETGRTRQRDSDRRSAAESSSPSRSQDRSTAPALSNGSQAFVCEYKCTNAKLLGSDKTSMTIRIRAADKSAAEDEVIRHGKATCYQQTQRVWDTASQRCRRE